MLLFFSFLVARHISQKIYCRGFDVYILFVSQVPRVEEHKLLSLLEHLIIGEVNVAKSLVSMTCFVWHVLFLLLVFSLFFFKQMYCLLLFDQLVSSLICSIVNDMVYFFCNRAGNFLWPIYIERTKFWVFINKPDFWGESVA